MAAELRNGLGAEVEVVDGGKGEFTVLADVRPVAGKDGDRLPEPGEVLAAVQAPAATGG